MKLCLNYHLLRNAPFAVVVAVLSSCAIPMREVDTKRAFTIALDANSKVQIPGRQIKFYVDITNQTPYEILVDEVEIELQVRPAWGGAASANKRPVSLREQWTYAFDADDPARQPPKIASGRKVTLPVVPELGAEFELHLLAEGNYEVEALVNGRYRSEPYPLRVARPDVTRFPVRHHRRREQNSTNGALRDNVERQPDISNVERMTE